MTSRLTILIVAGGLLVFAVFTVAVSVFLPANAAIYALFAGITGGFSGSLFTLLHIPTPSTTTTTAGVPPVTQTKTEQP